MVRFIANDYGSGVVPAMHDAVTDMGDLIAVDVGLAFETIEKVSKGGSVVLDGGNLLVFNGLVGRLLNGFE